MSLTFDAFPDTLDNYTFYVNGMLVQSGPATIFTYDDFPVGDVEVFVRAIDEFGEIQSNSIRFSMEGDLIADILTEGVDADPFEGLINFTAALNNEDGVSYQWDFGDEPAGSDNFSDLANPSYQYLESGTYNVRLIAENEVGCIDTLTKEQIIKYDLPAVIYIPNAFTPNDDGKNDILYVRGEGIEDLEFYVYNQWGELVFQTNDQNEGWDGRFKNKPASNCSYTYLVKAKMDTGDQEVRSGLVSIVR